MTGKVFKATMAASRKSAYRPHLPHNLTNQKLLNRSLPGR